MIFAESLPFAKPFFAAAALPASTVGLLTRFVVACLSTLRSACQAADAIRTDPRHRAQLVRFLARQGWARDWLTLERLADAVRDACLHERGDWLFILDQTTHTTVGWQAQNTYCCRNTKKRQKNSKRKQKQTPPRLNHVFVCGLLVSPERHAHPLHPPLLHRRVLPAAGGRRQARQARARLPHPGRQRRRPDRRGARAVRQPGAGAGRHRL
jgi:hypothetical protein